MFDKNPIVSCITGMNDNSAVKVIRLSGFDNLQAFQPFFSISLDQLRPRQVDLTVLAVHNNHQDNVLITFFKAPFSYTGENTLEISCHGNRLSVSLIINAFIDKLSFRQAGPGEFTYRALVNGKTTLSQVEGLDLFLNATNPIGLSQGFSLLHGELFKKYLSLREDFIKVKSSIEILIDFSEDVGEESGWQNLRKSFTLFLKNLSHLHNKTSFDNSKLLDPTVVLYGETNAGKSSLFNSLLCESRALVSSQRGTTRDYLTEHINLSGINFRVIDTAGLRDKTDDLIESQGIDRTRNLLSSAFFRILVVNPFDQGSDLNQTSPDFIIFTHLDVKGSRPLVKRLLSTQTTKIPYSHCHVGPIGPTSNKSGPIEPLCSKIISKYQKLQQEDGVYVVRHRDLLQSLYTLSTEFATLIQSDNDLSIIDHHLSIVGNQIEELLGIISPDEVLASIFENFCIGK